MRIFYNVKDLTITYLFKGADTLYKEILETDLEHCVYREIFYLNESIVPEIEIENKTFIKNFTEENTCTLKFKNTADSVDEFL